MQQQLHGAAHITEPGAYGPGGRAYYEGQPGDPDRLHWTGDTP
ncbi:hypothetical protein ACIQM3_20980 [Streptomyces sp. NPDC091271]